MRRVHAKCLPQCLYAGPELEAVQLPNTQSRNFDEIFRIDSLSQPAARLNKDKKRNGGQMERRDKEQSLAALLHNPL